MRFLQAADGKPRVLRPASWQPCFFWETTCKFGMFSGNDWDIVVISDITNQHSPTKMSAKSSNMAGKHQRLRSSHVNPGDSMYDLQWDDDSAPAQLAAPFQFTAEAAEAEWLEQRTATVEKMPQGMEVEALGAEKG